MNTTSNSILNALSRSFGQTSALSSARRLFDRAVRMSGQFAVGNSGNVGMMFAGMIIPTVALVGMSVDVGRALNERTIMQAALDSAVLAGGREYQITGETSDATAAAAKYFDAAVSPEVAAELTKNAVDVATNSIELAARVQVKTTFLKVLGINQIEVSNDARAELAQGGLDTDLEVAMMLDVTGSMCSPCSKIDDLKLAAKDLVDILVRNDQSEHKSRIALAPFAPAVNVGSAYFQAVTGEVQTDPHVYDYPADCYRSNGSLKGSCKNKEEYRTYTGHYYSSCVVERGGDDAFTDAAPGAGRYLGIHSQYTGSSSCDPDAKIVPMSDDKEILKDEIDNMSTGGMTAGHLGTAWAWYLLSPEWNSIWPVESQVSTYDSGSMKVAILMTDGDYNQDYVNENGDSDNQASTLCTNMKAKGITVYTVGFMVSSSAQTLLSNCATDSSHFFNAANGSELRAAFRQIGFELAQLRITK